MMGLVYKDFLVLRKQLLYYVAFMLFYTFMAVAGIFPSSILGGLVVVVGVLLPISSFSYDDLARWDKYAASTPAGRAGLVQGKYLFALLAVAAGGVISALLHLAVYALGKADGSMTDILLASGACVLVAVFMNAVVLPLLMKFGAEKSRLITMLLALVVFAVCIGAGPLLDEVTLPTPPAFLMTALPGLLALVSVGAYVISYFVSLGIYAKKQF